MGPLYYAGNAEGFRQCTKEIKAALPDGMWEWCEQHCDIKANDGAGSPELSREWNVCIAAVRLLTGNYSW